MNLNISDKLEHDKIYEDYYLFKEDKERQLTDELLKQKRFCKDKADVEDRSLLWVRKY